MNLWKLLRTTVTRGLEVDIFDVFDQMFNHRLMVEHLPRLMNGIQACMGLGSLGHKERAAIRSGLRRDIKRSDLLSTFDNLLLIGADKRTKNRHVDNLVDCHDVLERL